MELLILFVTLALAVSFACSVMEAVLLSVTPSHATLLESQGHKIAGPLAAMKANIDRPLVAILTLNTIAHTVGAAGAGAQAVHVFGDSAVGVFSAVLTLLILVGSEIIPKTLGASYWRELTPLVVRSLQAVVLALYPLVWAMEALTQLLSRAKQRDKVSREEVDALAQLSHEHGALAPEELRLLRSLFRFSSVRAQDVMTPRMVMVALADSVTVGDAIARQDVLRFSRIPIFHDTLDDIRGFVLKDHLLLEAAKDRQSRPIEELQRPLHVVPGPAPLPRVLEQMLKARQNIALVVDEYGGTAGILTTEDIVETLLGLEIVDELDSVADLQAHARKVWSQRASALGLVPSHTPEKTGNDVE